MTAIAFVDGENFRFKCKEVLKRSGVTDVNWDRFDSAGLISEILAPFGCKAARFYAAKIVTHPASLEKSRRLQEYQRRLKNRLERLSIDFVTAGRVRARETRAPDGRTLTTFQEKGVDVRLAVDMVSLASDNALDSAILLSSDSDLQPAIHELIRRGKSVRYVGFCGLMNRGMHFTATDSTEIMDSVVVSRYRFD